jgi:hypothetical protein
MENEIEIFRAGKIYEMLEHVRRRPQMYLTSKSITALQNLLNGYMIVNHAETIYLPGDRDLNQFIDWLSNKFGLHDSPKGNIFSTILLQECAGNEEQSFDRFFELLDDFKFEPTGAHQP